MAVNHPQWALAHKRKNTELRCIRGKYYLYEVKSVWDKEKQRARKITGKCLGSITPDGFVPSRPRTQAPIEGYSVRSKEYGGYSFFIKIFEHWLEPLKKYFPGSWKQIMCMAYLRLFHHSPIKNMPFYFEHSFFSEHFKDMAFSDKKLGDLIKEIGQSQSQIEDYLKSFVSGSHVALIDATALFSQSKNIYEARPGYNNKGRWDPQLNLLYLYDYQLSQPLYYRLVQGDIREVRTLEITIKSAGLENAVIVGDKGFTSELNMEIINRSELNYVLPLKRNSSMIDYSFFFDNDKKKWTGYFKFKERYIWYKSKEIAQGRRLTLYLDDQLRNSEESDYLDRISRHPDEYNQQGFFDNLHKMGTLALVDNLIDKSQEDIFTIYKSRGEIEQLFDVLKNIIHADRIYMHSTEATRGWLFINHLAIIAYYQIYKLLKEHKLLDKYSVEDFIMHLKHVLVININQKWIPLEVSKKTSTLIDKCNLALPIP